MSHSDVRNVGFFDPDGDANFPHMGLKGLWFFWHKAPLRQWLAYYMIAHKTFVMHEATTICDGGFRCEDRS